MGGRTPSANEHWSLYWVPISSAPNGHGNPLSILYQKDGEGGSIEEQLSEYLVLCPIGEAFRELLPQTTRKSCHPLDVEMRVEVRGFAGIGCPGFNMEVYSRNALEARGL